MFDPEGCSFQSFHSTRASGIVPGRPAQEGWVMEWGMNCTESWPTYDDHVMWQEKNKRTFVALSHWDLGICFWSSTWSIYSDTVSIPFFRWGHWGTESLPMVSQLVAAERGFKPQLPSNRVCALKHCSAASWYISIYWKQARYLARGCSDDPASINSLNLKSTKR